MSRPSPFGGWVYDDNLALLTDLYELRMLQSYWDCNMRGRAVFSLFFRELPVHRQFILACGQHEILHTIQQFHFSPEAIDGLRRLGGFKEAFLDWLSRFRFSGDIHALPEGTPVFANEPILEVEAPIAEGQLLESLIMNQVHLQSVLASKAARFTLAARGHDVVDFGMRRMHGSDAAVRACRAYWIAGLSGTSNILAGLTYDIPVVGTMAHSYIQAHDSEAQAFRDFARLYPGTTLLVDTYDSLEGVRRVIELSEKPDTDFRVGGVRLDSGDLGSLARQSRQMLDQAGLKKVKIFASGGLDEHRIAALLRDSAPIDAFGVGTSLGTASDSPVIDLAYKLTEYEGRGRTKRSPHKEILPGRKQVYRFYDQGEMVYDVLARRDEQYDGEPLLKPVMKDGQIVHPSQLLDLQHSRDHTAKALQSLPREIAQLKDSNHSFPVHISAALKTDAGSASLG